jgi:hypothetical protein
VSCHRRHGQKPSISTSRAKLRAIRITTCEECNNLTGRLYVPELSAWVRSGANALFGELGLAARYREHRRTVYAEMTIKGCKPGCFVKQVATMLLAMSPPYLGDSFPGLRTYAHDPNALGLPPELQLYLVLYAGPRGRYASGVAQVSGFMTEASETRFVYELAMPPYAYILSVQETTSYTQKLWMRVRR